MSYRLSVHRRKGKDKFKKYQESYIRAVNKFITKPIAELENDAGNHYKYSVITSFTIRDWMIINELVKRKIDSADGYAKNDLLRLCFNILPNMDHVLHKIANKKEGVSLKLIQGLFDSLECTTCLLRSSDFATNRKNPIQMPIYCNAEG